ncbi:MAG: hypothetical protein ACRC92_18780 [Peptostreptococcaceae bacterium]
MIRDFIGYIATIFCSIGAFILTGTFDTEVSYTDCDDIRKELYPFRVIFRTSLIAIEFCLVLIISKSFVSILIMVFLLTFIKYHVYVTRVCAKGDVGGVWFCTKLYFISSTYLILKILSWG